MASKTLHIAGTKGKGSVSAFCDSALYTAGYHTGFYSSPHLHWFRERVRRDTQPISEAKFTNLVYELWQHSRWFGAGSAVEEVSLFEFMTGMAFKCFADDHADFQTIEVGLGGRLDATNVVEPRVTAITSISLDHTGILGDTIQEIAAEKAGIIKPGIPVVIAPQVPEAEAVILSRCQELDAMAIRVGVDVTWDKGQSNLDGQSFSVKGRLGAYELWIPLLGSYQLGNAATAVGMLEVLMEQGNEIPSDAINRGFTTTSWPCRMEVLRQFPLVVADGAHNAHSVTELMASLPNYLDYDRLILVVGFSRDKNVTDMARLLAEHDPLVLATRSRHPRSVQPAVLAEEFQKCGVTDVRSKDSVSEALSEALELAGDQDLILATGSLFVAAELREGVLGIEPEVYPDLLPPDLRAPRPTN